jgi:hypothetical protein
VPIAMISAPTSRMSFFLSMVLQAPLVFRGGIAWPVLRP